MSLPPSEPSAEEPVVWLVVDSVELELPDLVAGGVIGACPSPVAPAPGVPVLPWPPVLPEEPPDWLPWDPVVGSSSPCPVVVPDVPLPGDVPGEGCVGDGAWGVPDGWLGVADPIEMPTWRGSAVPVFGLPAPAAPSLPACPPAPLVVVVPVLAPAAPATAFEPAPEIPACDAAERLAPGA